MSSASTALRAPTAPIVAPSPAPKRRRHVHARRTRALVALAIAVPVSIAALGYGVHHVPWLGPLLADSLRIVLGDRAVSRLEELLCAAEDRWNRFTRGEEKAKAYWQIPSSTPTASPAASEGEVRAAAGFRPADVGPLYREVAAPGDGEWVPVEVPAHPTSPPLLYKTLIHPDRKRPWAELFVAAIDARRVRLFVVAGTDEPKTETAEGRSYVRRGLIPVQHRAELVAAFNGGFKAEHGHYGMRVDGVTLLTPREGVCTIAAYVDGSLRIGTWRALADTQADMVWWRQTPACMVEGGTVHPGLANEASISWGAALGGDTVVRRSALALNADRSILYMGVSNATTARAIALGMQHLGATDVAQLDINWSYPRFVMFGQTSSGQLEGFGLFDGFVFDKNEYLARPSPRDFFYVIRSQD